MGTTSADLTITGMHCASCVALIEEALAEDPGVSDVAVSLDAARATVAFDPGRTSVEALCMTIAELGYAAAPAPALSP